MDGYHLLISDGHVVLATLIQMGTSEGFKGPTPRKLFHFAGLGFFLFQLGFGEKKKAARLLLFGNLNFF